MTEENWKENLPESLQAWDEVKNSDSPEKFWKQMEDMRSFVGRSIQIPAENSNAEEWNTFHDKLLGKVPGLIHRPDFENEESVNKFYDALGRPEKPEAYKMPEFDAKGVEMNDQNATEFATLAHKYGLTQDQFSGIVKEISESNVDKAIQHNIKLEEDTTKLRNDWGMAFDVNTSKVKNLLKLTGAPDYLVDQVEKGQLGSKDMQWLLGIANSFKQEGTNLNDDETTSGLMAPEQAAREITAIMNNKEHEYWDPAKPGHQLAKEYVRKLYQMKTGGQKPVSTSYNTVGVGGMIG